MKENKTTNNEILQLVSFSLDKEEFGVDISAVHEINRMTEITKLPGSPDFVEGIINLRGKVVPVISLRKRLGMAKKGIDKDSRVIVVELEGNTIGFIVDAVNEVLRIDSSTTEAPPAIFYFGMRSDYIKSLAKLEDRILILLNIENVLTGLEVFEVVEEI